MQKTAFQPTFDKAMDNDDDDNCNNKLWGDNAKTSIDPLSENSQRPTYHKMSTVHGLLKYRKSHTANSIVETMIQKAQLVALTDLSDMWDQ
jgi:hypothetical protein